MKVKDILTQERVLYHATPKSKKRLLEAISELISENAPGLHEEDIFEALVERERLGSTALGQGIAIPHARTRHTEEIIGAFIQLAEPIDFDTPDGEPADLFFTLLVPEEANDDHLIILSTLASIFNNPDNLCKLREAHSREQLFSALMDMVA